MKTRLLFTLLACLYPALMFSEPITLKNPDLALSVAENGVYSSISVNGHEILAGTSSPVIIACSDGGIILPQKVRRDGNSLRITMDDRKEIVLDYKETPNCITFKVRKAPGNYDAVMFGPVKVKLHETVGEVVGVVQGEGLAMGIQALNSKTTGGIPQEYSDIIKDRYLQNGLGDVKALGNVPDFMPVAVDLEDGAAFLFSCRNRTREQQREVENLKGVTVSPVKGPEALIDGAAIALFGCPAPEALNRIGAIETEQGLPHPIIGNEWGKTARSAMCSYLITDFSEDNLDFVLDKAEIAGFKYVYHPGPFKDWGHFNWEESFVRGGDAAVKKLVDTAGKRGIALGVHTLTNFTTTNDAYVTPTPSQHLLKQGSLKLLSDLDDSQEDILIKKSELFSRPMSLNAMMIDNELITYSEVQDLGDSMMLKKCRRGAFGTVRSSHSSKTPLYKLWDHGYKTLFPDYELQTEFVDRLVDIFNTTGLKQISFDGLEGCCYTGHDDLARVGFVERFHNGVKHNVINDASNLNHFAWHIHTRMNWGEPWGEAMRTGQLDVRLRNQKYFRRNLFPRMLGWFLIRLADKKFECSTLEDLEWALAEAAGFDAGYAMNIGIRTLKNHGRIDEMLETIKHWDLLREKMAFTPRQMERLKDPATDWHLRKDNDSEYSLFPLHISKHYTCSLGELQPGQPAGADWSLTSPYAGKFAIKLKVDGDGYIENPRFATANGTIVFPCRIENGQYLLFDMEGNARVTDRNYNLISSVAPQGNAEVAEGDSGISFTCDREADSTPDVVIQFTTHGAPEKIRL